VKDYRYFGGTRRLHLQGWRINQVRIQNEAGSKQSVYFLLKVHFGLPISAMPFYIIQRSLQHPSIQIIFPFLYNLCTAVLSRLTFFPGGEIQLVLSKYVPQFFLHGYITAALYLEFPP
jgi:hypothetical protein